MRLAFELLTPPDLLVLVDTTTRRGAPGMLVGLLAAIGAVGVMIFVRELPSLRRYMRIERM